MKFNKDIIYLGVIILLIAMCGQFYYDYQYSPQTDRQISVYYNKQTEANLLVINTIDNAEQYVYFAIYTFTRADIKDALLGAKYRGLDVRGLVDKSQITRIPEQGKIIAELQASGIPIYVQDHSAIMHLKTVVTDKEYLSGSYNWTKSGTDFNDEIIELGRDPKIKQRYDQIIRHLFDKYAPR